MTDTSVRVYQSTDTGAPAVSGTAGALITLLDACLQDGYGSVTLDSIVVASGIATCTKSAGHGFTALGTVGPVIRIAGATPSGLNGDWRITYVSATVFTFAAAGVTNQTATGTITAKRAPLGFTKAFTGTNKAVYRANDIVSTRLYLRVVDSTTTYATVMGYGAMSDVDTGTGLFPAAARYLTKSSAASATARAWKLIGDGRLFYLIVTSNADGYRDALAFGDINSFKAGDAYHCWLCAATASSSYGNSKLHANTGGSDLARSYSQAAGPVVVNRYSHGIATTNFGGAGVAYPSAVDSGFHAWPIEVWETTVAIRGVCPGLYSPLHSSATLADATIITDVPQLLGRSLYVLAVYSTTADRSAFDISGPWR